METMTLQEMMLIGLLYAGMCLAIMAPISYGLTKFVALKARPSDRSAWTAGAAYLIVTGLFIFGGVPGHEAIAPLAALPGGLITFWYWRMEFRKAWIEDPEHLAENQTLANDDWRVGLWILVAAIVIAVVKALPRFLSH
jgi:hypothetical protein